MLLPADGPGVHHQIPQKPDQGFDLLNGVGQRRRLVAMLEGGPDLTEQGLMEGVGLLNGDPRALRGIAFGGHELQIRGG